MGGCQEQLPNNVTVNGLQVGGMRYDEALSLIREQIAGELPSLTLRGKTGVTVLSYPRLGFTDNAEEVLSSAKRGDVLTVAYERTAPDLEGILEHVCAVNALLPADAVLSVTENGFEYTAERAGESVDYRLLEKAVLSALKNGETEVTLPVFSVAPEVTVEDLKERTQLLSSFTTYFDGDNRPRSENIRLSASRISGTQLLPGESFSFNGCVGLRTAENGYQTAVVIQNGVFAEGIGGGVCQTSTTLYNAALTSGMVISESHAHTLSIGYVPPSLDAMVSEYSDLAFYNPYEYPVYLFMQTEEGSITASIYGMPSEYEYRTESVFLERIAPPEREYRIEEGERVIREEKEGLRSESYLLTLKDGEVVSRTLLRTDRYEPVGGIYRIPPEEGTVE